MFYDFHTAVYATNSIARIFDTVFRNNSGLYIASLEVPHAALGLYNCEAFLATCDVQTLMQKRSDTCSYY